MRYLHVPIRFSVQCTLWLLLSTIFTKIYAFILLSIEKASSGTRFNFHVEAKEILSAECAKCEYSAINKRVKPFSWRVDYPKMPYGKQCIAHGSHWPCSRRHLGHHCRDAFEPQSARKQIVFFFGIITGRDIASGAGDMDEVKF